MRSARSLQSRSDEGAISRAGRVSTARPARLLKLHRSPVAPSAATTEQAATWTGSDAFTQYGDRVDAPPLPLPPITTRRRVVLVRHGQSTWNAEGRIQGSSDLSSLTPKGVAQAETTRDMVGGRG
jgi:hypothetical protein